MKSLYTALMLLIFPSIIFAQSNYYAGYVLKSNGDTLKGFINYREWTKSPRSIAFKINKDDRQKMEFNPVSIKGFQINGMDTYVSFIGMITMNPTSFNEVSHSLDTVKVTDTIFLKQITTGKHLTLFSQQDELKKRYFIAETNDSPTELLYYISLNEDNQILTSPAYKGQLLLYINKFAPENNKLIQMANQSRYDKADFQPIVDLINNNITTFKTKIAYRFFSGLGVNQTITEINNVYYYTSTVPKHYTTIAPKISLGVDLFGNPYVQQLVLRMEMSFSYVKPEYNIPIIVATQNTYILYSFNQYTTSLTPQLLFNVYNKDKFKVYFDAGITLNFSVYTDNNLLLIMQILPLQMLIPLKNPISLSLTGPVSLCRQV